MQHYNYTAFRELDPSARKNYLTRVERLLGDFQLKEVGTKSGRPPLFEHTKSQIEFGLIPSGTATIGLSEAEEKAARAIADPPPLTISEMRPTAKKTVSSLLMSTRPMGVGAVKKLFGKSYLSDYDLKNSQEDFPAYVERSAAVSMSLSLGCRLPYEVEWEYACRANTKTLFVWGNKLPSNEELTAWLDLERPDKLRRNTFGLSALFSGDWCMDEWKASHEDRAKPTPGVFVIKGGGSVFWPWQGSGEWIWCMPANRMPSTSLLEEGRCAFRLVRELSPTGS